MRGQSIFSESGPIIKGEFCHISTKTLIVRYLSFTIDLTKMPVPRRFQREVRLFMNEKHVQQVLEIEKKAQEIHEAAVKEAQQLPVTAEQEAQALIEKAKAEAQQQAREMVSTVRAEDESARILAEAEEKARQLEEQAKRNFDRAVAYVLERVAGRA